MKKSIQILLVASSLLGGISHLHAQGLTFTYQGRLDNAGVPYSGSAEFKATLWDALGGGTSLATNNPVPVIVSVTNGLFVLPLNFGATFSGGGRWLELEVRTTFGPFNVLSPRQPLTPTPYAITASNLSGTLPAAQVSGVLSSASLGGTYGGAVTFSNAGNSFTGNGGGLTNLNASQLGSGTVSDARLSDNVARTNQVWLLGGNAGTTPGTHFVGTTDNQSLELRVNATRALRLEPNATSPNVIGGYVSNSVSPGIYGATIAGGGRNGFVHTISAHHGTVGGGDRNTVNGEDGTIAGGGGNLVTGNYSSIGGGIFNMIQTNADFATIGGGSGNTIQTSAHYATIGGGNGNTIQANANFATVGGGYQNTIQSDSAYATIGGGVFNTIQANAVFATIPGGYLNSAASFAFAAGYRANANHTGAFVWADSQESDFASTANNQFSVRAAGGVRLSDSTPNLSFGQTGRQMIKLYDSGVNSTFGIGVQSSTFYLRAGTGSGFAWFSGGTHNDGQNNPGGGTLLMRLDGSGNLFIAGAYSPSSDRNVKTNFASVSAREILEKVTSLPISNWAYRQDAGTKHIGPMAQDFHAAFGLGTDDKHIATVDADGVALAAIQGLNQKMEEKEARVTALEKELAELKQLVVKLSGKGN